MRRLEDPPLLQGRGRFTDDFAVEGQSYATFVRSPHPHARLTRIDIDAAARSDGVLAVLTGADYVGDGCQGIAHTPVPADTLRHDIPAFGAFEGRTPLDVRQEPLVTDVVRYAGEAAAVVIAETAAQARDAAALVNVEYEVLSAALDIDAATRPGAPQVFDERPDNVAVEGEFGDRVATEAALAAAAVVVEHEFSIQRIVNAQLEPRAAIGTYDSESRQYLMIAGSQGAVRQRAILAAALNVPIEQVRVVCPDVGGGFGPRTALYPEQVVVTWAARRVGRPVRWTSDRSEGFLTDFQGREAFVRARLGLAQDGRLAALAVDLTSNVGGQTQSYVPLSNAARVMTGVYDIPSACVRVRGVLTHTVPTGPYRGAGRPEAMFIIERLLDIAAVQVGIDRVELRQRNLIARERLPYASAVGLTYESGDFPQNMQRALELADWRGFAARREAAGRRGRLAGIGMANYIESPVGAPHERVLITRQPDGSVEVRVGTQSTGQGHATAFAQVVADQLAIAPECVRIISGDTVQVQAGGGTHSDRSLRLVSALLVEACSKVKADGSNSAEAFFTGRMPAHPTGCAVCELEIDPETGAIEITRYTCVDDVGQPINPRIVHGQVHGGIAQGLGQALFEAGGPLVGSFLDYALPRARHLPWFTSELVEDPLETNPLRVKGGGESGITPCMAAIVNAAADALGAQDLGMPLTYAVAEMASSYSLRT
jgi:carbon-monoxide dehydrogenase large subunit